LRIPPGFWYGFAATGVTTALIYACIVTLYLVHRYKKERAMKDPARVFAPLLLAAALFALSA
jgi:dTDP-4-dehydrorhamnose 3,5-epimerase-like enzyme